MCDLCSYDSAEREKARKSHMYIAERLQELSRRYSGLATGSIKPHGDEAKTVGYIARSLIVELVNSWV